MIVYLKQDKTFKREGNVDADAAFTELSERFGADNVAVKEGK